MLYKEVVTEKGCCKSTIKCRCGSPKLILKYLVIEDRNPIEIFDEMIQYVETTIPPEQYTRKQKQDAMSLMKRRAKLHLRMLIVEQRKQKKQ